MAKQTLNIGTSANDGTGTNLRSGGTIINDNFNEIYTAIGDGNTITFTPSSSVALTNKTISGSSNTLLNIGNSSLTNSSFGIRDDSSSAISISLGGTLKLKSNDGITTTVSQGDTITIGLDSNIVTETSSDVLTNKTIAAGSNTITGLTNTNLSGTAGITNANIQNAFIQFSDESSTSNSVSLGGKLEFLAGEGINTIVGASSLTISAELATSSNAGVATFNTASFGVSTGDVTIKSGGVSNAQLVNSTVSIGGNTITLGAAATTSISNLSLTGNGTIDSTGSGNKIRFNFANVGARPDATTYQGALAVVTGSARLYFADSGGWNEIANENSSINLFTDVDLVTAAPTGKQTLSWVSASGKFIPATLGATTLLTGDGSTVNFTINNLYTVNNILVFVNGICLEPTNDYTVSGTTLTFVTAPVSAASIMIRYLG
jgi:hypothetical protein